MSDDLTQRGAPDRIRINVHEPHEVRYWTCALGVTAEQLRDLVARHGVMAAAVRQAIESAR